MLRRGGTAALIIVAIACAVLAAPASAATTRAEYIAQADPICAEANTATKKQLKGYPGDVAKERWKSAARRFRNAIRIFNGLIASLSQLQPTAADAPLVDQWLAGLRAQTPLARDVLRATRKRSLKKIIKTQKPLFKASDATQELVADFGFRACDNS